MTPLATLTRWALVATASLLALLALLLLILRLAFSQADGLIPRIESLLEGQIGAPVTIESLALSLERNDLVLRLDGLEARTDEAALVSLESAYLRLDSWASLKEWAPIFSDVRATGLDFHLYQLDEARWGWPEPARLPLALADQPDVDLDRIDRWTELILRQRLWMRESQLTFHGDQGALSLNAPRLLLAGNEELARFEGTVNIVDDDPERDSAQPALVVQAEMQPGRDGPNDFSAVVQAKLQLDHLVGLGEVFRTHNMPYIEQAGGSVRVWGEWFGGRLQQVRTGVDIPQLTLRHQQRLAVLRRIEANGQWQRDDEGGEAWLSANAESVEWAQPDNVSEGPALPRHWYLNHQPGRWGLRTSAFELASLTAWREYVFLPESVTRVLQTLSPSGQVQGLALGQLDGRWGVDAALTNLSVEPWQQAPGGGPLDAWVQARDSRGRVMFASPNESQLYFPELFAEPMQLQSANGLVEWVYDGPRAMVSGRDLDIRWDGAEITGGFGLVNAPGRGQFGLNIDFANVDAVERPLTQWLPVKVLGEGLKEWLADDVGGFVPEGSVRLGLPLGENRAGNPASLALSLDVERGFLPIAEGWPMLEQVEGRLGFQNQVLSAQVERAVSLGIEARQGEVKMEDETLTIDGLLSTDADGLLDFIEAIPEVDTSFLADIQASGQVDGELKAQVALENPEALTLEINARPRLSRVNYTPFARAPLTDVEGDMTWQQRGSRFALTGSANGRLLEGLITARFDVPDSGITLSGELDTGALFTLAGVASEPARALIDGRTGWEGLVRLEPTPYLRFESDLEGVESALPEPFNKPAWARWPLRVEANIERGALEATLSDVFEARLLMSEGIEGAVAVGRAAPLQATPLDAGLRVEADIERLDVAAWQRTLALLAEGGGETAPGEFPPLEEPLSLMFDTPCLAFDGACLGELSLSAQLADRALDARVGGDIVSGRVAYRQSAERPLDITVAALDAERLMGLSTNDDQMPAPSSWMAAVETTRPAPLEAPAWLERVPNGRLRLAEVALGNSRIGPLTAYWQTGPRWLSVSPVGLTLDELSLTGELWWQGHESTADVMMRGGDIGSALERLDQPVPIRSRASRANARLEWPGAPWQLDLARATGRLDAELVDGRFLSMSSPSARLVGLLNFDNILRRLRLDFSDLTGEGTAFDRIQGSAGVAGGRLTLREPLQIEAPAATLRLTGHVNLLERELDQRLGVTLPVSQTLPIAALAVGAPAVGAALLVADQLIGDSLNRATTLHFRVQGPWTSPRVTLEGP
ncbi:YhdP family protein [Halomonas sp. HNIBRBA4712]|uniref:YhdP family phospholipid transporter n=1 Tax=Halomonas sp. HNIBRBA4712 TaxID=3373087 RepID=UPI0037477087